ncbi:MAG TPA: DUF6055 domain-containing protein [Paludibacter sp.]|nr:DUF6055 domain-containing protein [Paludibacter sp.]
MKKKLLRDSLLLLFSSISFFVQGANQGDTITINGRRFKLLSANLITNPGFENGFTGWTDATPSAATLTTDKFSIPTTGGVGNSKYLVGLASENSSSPGSIGTGWAIGSGKTYLFAYQVKYLSTTTAAGSESYLKISCTNDKTSPSEPSILLNSATVSGNSAWTQNFIYFTNTNPAYSYIMARFRWLDNRLGFDDFMLHEAVEVVGTDALQTLINQAQALYKADAEGATDLQTAITTAQGYLNSTSPTEVSTAVTNLQKAIQTYKYANASPGNPLDMTSFIKNQGFDNNDTTGWEGAGTANYHEVEFYQTTFDMHQTISGLPAGKYRLNAKGFERPKPNDSGAAYKAGTETIYAKLYAESPGYSGVNIPFNSLYKHTYSGTGSSNGYANTMAAAETMLANTSTSYYDMAVPNIFLDEGGKLTIGAKSDFQQTGYWALFDNFKLEYLGKADLNDRALALSNRVAEAQGLLTLHIQNSATNGLNTAVAQSQAAASANPLIDADLSAAKTAIDAAINTAYTSLATYAKLQKAINDANLILTFLEKADETTKLQNAISAATLSYNDLDLTLTGINSATSTLVAATRSVGKQIYNPSWMMGDIYSSSNNWSIERSKQSKNWILFWEPGFGNNPGATVDDCLALAEKCFLFYADSLKFITRGSSKTDAYKMIIRLRYSTDWEASGSGVDNIIGLLTLTPSALNSRGGQTIAHEVGHCFQYQTHCDNNDSNGWMYGFGSNASGSNGWWEQCAQWQAYKVFPTQQFTNEWFSGYLSNAHKNILNETYRYNDFFVQDYWCYLHGMDMIGRLWNKSIKPEDPVEAYKRLNVITQTKFNDEMWDCAARFATWDIPALKSYGASYITSRTQTKMNNTGNYVWRVDSTVCLENYGHNIIRVNAPLTAKTVTANFEGLAGTNGFRKNYVAYAGWRYGFVALLKDGTRLYGDIKSGSMSDNAGKGSISFDCPANCDKLWLVVSGAPTTHWRHAWDDNDANDEQWPYQVRFNNTNYYGYTNIVDAVDNSFDENLDLTIKGRTLVVNNIETSATVRIYSILGHCMLDKKLSENSFSTNLPSGVYIVSVQTGQGLFNKKIIVE